MKILDFLVYGFVYGLIGAAVIALVAGIATLAVECYKEMGVPGLVANMAAWASLVTALITPLVFPPTMAAFAVLIGGIALSPILMSFAMGTLRKQGRKGTISLVGHWSPKSQYPTTDEVSAALKRMK